VQVAVGDGRAVDLGLEHRALHGASSMTLRRGCRCRSGGRLRTGRRRRRAPARR
jgi:hypothetical protein